MPPPDAKQAAPLPSSRPPAPHARPDPLRRETPRASVIRIGDRRVSNDGAVAVGAAPPIVKLDSVRRAWEELVDRAKAQSTGKAAQLVMAEPLAIEGATIVIGFGDEFARSLWQDKRRSELEQDLSSILKAAIRIKCVRQPGVPELATPTDDPMLRAAIETLGRPDRIMEIE